MMHTLTGNDATTLILNVRQQPRPEIASEQECASWLNGIWGGIDAWIQAQAAVAELAQKPAAP